MRLRMLPCPVLLISFFSLISVFNLLIFCQPEPGRPLVFNSESSSSDQQQQMELVPGSYLVEFEENLPASAQANAAGSTQGGPSAAVRRLRDLIVQHENAARGSLGLSPAGERDVIVREYRLLFNGLAARLQAPAAEALRRVPGVKAVWPERVMRASVQPAPVPQPAPTPDPQLPGIPGDIAQTGQGTVIAIIDTGIDYRHPDLGGCLGPGCKVIGGYDFVNHDSDPLDDAGHGTHVAGIAAANGQMRGVAPEAKLLAVKVLSDRGRGTEGDIIAGMEWAVANGADVINMSLGGPPWPENDPASQAAERAVDNGVVVVIAAGNSGPRYYTIGSPGIAHKAVTVGAAEADKVAEFSSRGPTLDLFLIKPDLLAPGVAIRSTLPIDSPGTSEPYGTKSGTSMAAPYIAGVAALLLERSPDWTPLQIKHGLVAHARGLSLSPFIQGAGLADIEKALASRTTVSEGPVGLGLLHPSASDLSKILPLEFTNSSAETLVYDLQFDGELPPGFAVSLSTTRLVLSPGQTASVNLGIAVSNAPLTDPIDYPCDLSTTLLAHGATDDLRLPIAVVKGAVLTFQLRNSGFKPGEGPVPALVLVHDGKGQAYDKRPDWIAAGGFRLVLPPGTYDALAYFPAARSPFDAMLAWEGFALDSEVQLTLDVAQAVHELKFQPSYPGNPGKVTPHGHGILTHKSSGVGVAFSSQDKPLRSSNVSDSYSLDMALVGVSAEPALGIYTLNTSLSDGISSSHVFENDPNDFYHLRLDHSLRTGGEDFTSFAQLALGNFRFPLVWPTGSSDPLDRTRHLYLGVPQNPASAVAQLSEFVMQGNSVYQTAGWHARSRSEVCSNPVGNPDMTLSSGSFDVVLTGIGPYYWAGRFANSKELVGIQAVSPTPILVLGQAGDFDFFQGGNFELRREGAVAQTGSVQPPAWSIPVDPGRHTFTMDVFNPSEAEHPGKVTVDFDTTFADPNPPYIAGFRFLKDQDFSEVLSATRGRSILLKVGEETALAQVAIIYQAGDRREEIQLTDLGENEYRGELPPLTEADFADLAIELEDTSGNALRFETRIRRGFPDLTVRAVNQKLTVGRTVARQITVANRGFDSTDSRITVTEQMPDGLQFVRAAGEGWECSAVDRILTCECANQLQARSETSFTVFTRVARAAYPSAQGTISVFTPEDRVHTNDAFQYSVQVDGTSWWTGLGPEGGEVYSLAPDPNNKDVLYAGTRGQILRSDDGGTSWVPLTQSLPDAPISTIAIHPARPEVMYAGTDGSGMYKSSDQGRTWVALESSLGPGGTVIVIRIDPRQPETVYAGAAQGAERSTDGGRTWSALPMEHGRGVSDFAFHTDDASVVYAGTAAGIFKSTDAGSHWSLSLAIESFAGSGLFDTGEDPGNHLKWARLAFDPYDPSTLFATTMAGLYWTTNNGSSWQRDPQSPSLQGGDIVLASNSERTIFVVRQTLVGRRPMNASWWQEVSVRGVDADRESYLIDSLVMSADGTTLYAATRSGIFRGENNGVDWTPAGEIAAIGTRSLVFDPFHPGLLYLVSDRGITAGSGSEWTVPSFHDLRNRQDFFVADPLREGTFYAAGPGVFKTTDGGKSWNAASQGLSSTALQSVSALALDPRNGTTLYLGTSHKSLGRGAGVFRSTDGAASWQAVNTGLPSLAGVTCLAIEPVTGSLFAGITFRPSYGSPVFALYRTSNNGGNWILVGRGLPSAKINLLAFGGTAIPGALFIGTEGRGVYRSDDGGLNWAAVTQGLSANACIRAIAIDPGGVLFAAAYGGGVFRSGDGGGHWEAFNEGLSNPWVTSLAFDPNDARNLYVATSSGLFSMTLSPDFELSASRTEKPLTGGAAVWSLNLVNKGSAANSEQIELEFSAPPGLRLLRSAGEGWTCTDGDTTVRCLSQARVAPGASAPPLAVTYEVDEQAESSLTAEIRADAPEDATPQNDLVVDEFDAMTAHVSRIPFLRTDPETFVGLALSSQSPEPVEAVLTALDKDGKLLDLPRNPFFLTLESGSQLARQTSELFGQGQNPVTEGWVRIATDQPAGNMYQFGADRQLDGGVAAFEVSKTLFFTRACEGEGACWGFTGRTVIGLANPGSTPVTVRAVLSSTEPGGGERELVRVIPAKGSLAGSLSELFGAGVVRDGYVTVDVVEGAGGIVGSQQVQLTETRSLVSLPGQPVVEALRLYSAQLADVPGLFTSLKLINTDREARTVRVRALGDGGQPIAEQREVALDGLSGLEVNCGDWLQWLPGITRIGSLIVEADGPGVLGDVLFGGTEGETAAALPLQSQGYRAVDFGQVANGMGLYTGVALYNPGEEAVQVTILVTTADGRVAGQTTLGLEPGTRLSKLVAELLPSTAGQIGGAVRITSTAPIVAQQLFGGANILSAVPPLEVR